MKKRKREIKRDAVPADSDADDDDSGSAASTEDSPAKQNDALIKAASRLSSSLFKKRYINGDMLTRSHKTGLAERHVTLDFKAAPELSKEELMSCFALIETTSRADYEPSSFGWYPKRKRREMLEKEMKYLLVKDQASAAEGTPIEPKDAESAAGFLSFMMTHDSTPSVPVLYIYEIHLEERLRKSGLGSHFMKLVEDIAVKVGVEKVMLTCFLSNEKALAFYRKRGYQRDECSPEDRKTRKKVVKVDYVIMSKSVKRAAAEDGIPGAQRSQNVMLGAIQDSISKLAGTQMRSGEDVAQMRGWV